MKHYNIPVFVPHMGCPHDCVFCSQRTITGTADAMTPQKARNIIDDYLSQIKPSGYIEIAFFGGSFTGIDKQLRLSLLSVGKEYIDKGLVHGIRLSTRPDYISDEILKELESFGVTAIELGVQSMDDDVLRKSGRGHDSACVESAVKLIRKYPFRLGLQMMTGLPGDTFEKSVATAQTIAKLNPDMVRIYPTLVIHSTVLYDMMNSGEYTPWSVDETVELLVRIKEIFDCAKIKIIRMGLQTTEEINPGASVAGGPFHEAIGELVVSRKFLKQLMDFAASVSGDCLQIACNEKDVSAIVGHKRCNAKQIYKKYKKKLKLCPDKDIQRGELRLLR